MGKETERIAGKAAAIFRAVELSVRELTDATAEIRLLASQIRSAGPEIEVLREIVPTIEELVASARPDVMLTTSEIAERIGVGVGIVKNLYYDGIIPGYQMEAKGWLRFDWVEVRQALKDYAYHEAARAV